MKIVTSNLIMVKILLSEMHPITCIQFSKG